jgi:hypothetical protein
MSNAIEPATRPPLSHPGFAWDKKPSLDLHLDEDDPRFTITAHEPCHACEGEGHVMVEVRGGRWNSYIGTWEPDERPEECIECDGRKTFDRTRCAACGRIHEEYDQWGLRKGEEGCECDPADVVAAIASFHGVKRIIRRNAAHLAEARKAGVSIMAGVHSIPWNIWCALVAEKGLRWQRFYRTQAHQAFLVADAAIELFDGTKTHVSLFTDGPEKEG